MPAAGVLWWASATSAVTSPNLSVSPPLAVMVCSFGTPSLIAVSVVIGAPTTGALVCFATGPTSEM